MVYIVYGMNDRYWVARTEQDARAYAIRQFKRVGRNLLAAYSFPIYKAIPGAYTQLIGRVTARNDNGSIRYMFAGQQGHKRELSKDGNLMR